MRHCSKSGRTRACVRSHSSTIRFAASGSGSCRRFGWVRISSALAAAAVPPGTTLVLSSGSVCVATGILSGGGLPRDDYVEQLDTRDGGLEEQVNRAALEQQLQPRL